MLDYNYFLLLYFLFLTIWFIIVKNYTKPKNYSGFQHLLESPYNYQFNKNFLNQINYLSSPLIKCLDDFCKENNIYNNGVIVSLSGGVDSMVLFAILLFLQKNKHFNIFTATIDYGLRKESKDESRFIQKYTSTFNIKSYISYIVGISRKKDNSGSRTEFEEESRNLRFNTYKNIIFENHLSLQCGIFVAHHQDDIIENIFTNSMKGSNLLDLEVMKKINRINGVNIFRPFLPFKKQIIYDFAHTFNIPYFLDTTPKWSRRGKMRNEIFPLFDSVFTPDWKNKLIDLGNQSNQWGNYIDNFIIKPWIQDIHFGTSGIIIPIKNQPSLIYNIIIMNSLHSIGQNMIKKTSLTKIMDLISFRQNKLISLDGSRLAFINDFNQLIIFKHFYTYNNEYHNDNIFICLINNKISKSLPLFIRKIFN